MPLPPPADSSAESLADWLEAHLLAQRLQGMGVGSARALLVSATGTTDASAGMAVNAMRRREVLLGDKYPFAVNSVGITRLKPIRTVYEALALMASSAAPFRSTTPGFDFAVLAFEQIVCDAVCGLLGPGSAALRFGWPSQEGRPREFSAAIGWLAERMGTGLGKAYRPPRRKDGGVDVVGWRPFADEKPGFPIMLVQCTLERDYVHKSRDIDRRIWAGWLAFDADPLTALAIPHVVPREEDWREMASNVIVLDRLRLTSLIPNSGHCSIEIGDWVEEQVSGIAELLE